MSNTYFFIRPSGRFTNTEDDRFKVLDTQTMSYVVNDATNSPEILKESELLNSSQYSEDFSQYKKSEAYSVGLSVESRYDMSVREGKINEDEMRKAYNELIYGVCQIRASKANKAEAGRGKLIVDWLSTTDFYDAPASTIYHESFPHGLLYHTLMVYENMTDLLRTYKFDMVDIASATLCCLVHDWCKIGLYEPYLRNVKDPNTGIWNQVKAYKRSDFPHPFGHGAASMYMAQRMFKLTEEEALAIRWHQGRWNVCDAEQNEYQQSCERYPLVHLIQFADQLAITYY